MSNNDFRRGDAIQIAHKCTIEISGHDHQLAPIDTLFMYGIRTGEQLSLIRKEIINNPAIGLRAYRRSIDPNALRNMTRDWSINDLSKVIFNDSFPTESLKMRSDKLAFKPEKKPKQIPLEKSPRAVNLIFLAIGFTIGFLLKDMLSSPKNKSR